MATVCYRDTLGINFDLTCLVDHVGVVKAFLDAGLLPRVVTGTSAGGLIAALVCTRTDDELKLLLVPDLANKITACEEPYNIWIKRFWKTGARFDSMLYVFFSGRFMLLLSYLLSRWAKKVSISSRLLWNVWLINSEVHLLHSWIHDV